MNAPLLFILAPIILGAGLWFLSRRGFLTSLLASIFCLVLALLAGLLPVDRAFMLGSTRLIISSQMDILGRQLILEPQSMAAVILLFALGALWFLGIRPAMAPRRMAPLGMVILGLAVATLAVRPFLFAAVLLVALALVSIPLLIPAGQTPGRGVLRYIIFMTLAMPVVLLAGAMAERSGLPLSGGNSNLFPVIFLLLGFAIWLGVFPLNTWMPMLAEEAPPFVTGFLLSILSTLALLMLKQFLGEYSWLANFPDLAVFLRIGGVVTVVSAGIWTAFQTRITRLLGYAVIFENGMALLMLAAGAETAAVFSASLPTRLLGIAVFALSLAALRRAGYELTFKGLEGAIFKKPILVLAMMSGFFSLAGLPLLASFPVRMVLFEHLAQGQLGTLFWVGVGVGGFLVSGIRLLFSTIRSESPRWQIEEDRFLSVMLILGVLFLLSMGLFPALSLDWIITRL